MDSVQQPSFLDELLAHTGYGNLKQHGSCENMSQENVEQIQRKHRHLLRDWSATTHSVEDALIEAQEIGIHSSEISSYLEAIVRHVRMDSGVLADNLQNFFAKKIPSESSWAQYCFAQSQTANVATEYVIKHIAQSDSVVLDYGCGNGRDVLAYAKSHVRKVIGIDKSTHMILQARMLMNDSQDFLRSKTEIILATSCDSIALKENMNEINLIIANSVFQLLTDSHVRTLLQQMRDVLTPYGGRLAISQKESVDAWEPTEVVLFRKDDNVCLLNKDGRPRSYRTIENLQNFITHADFQVDDIVPILQSHASEKVDRFNLIVATAPQD